MTGPRFIAFVHDAGNDSVVRDIARRHRLPYVRRCDLAAGRLTLCLRSEVNEPADRDGSVLVDLNMTRSTAVAPMPTRLVNTDIVPKGLLDHIHQFHSYLCLDNRKRAVFWTDHVGFSKIFHASVDGGQVFSDDLAAFHALGFDIDYGMVASYLINGSMLANRTLFESVRSLPPATAIVATPQGLQEHPYWRFEPSIEAGADEAGVAEGLWARTEAAVLRHAGENEVLLPLSGGYDSTSILGVLAAAKRDVSAFTYVNGTPQPGSDADVSRRQAELLGIEHRTFGIESASFLEMLKANIDAGLYMRNANYEISALADAVSAVKDRFDNPMFCFGEESYGGPSYRLNSDNDILGSVILKSPERLRELEPALGRSIIDQLRGELQRTHDSLFDTSIQGHDPKDQSDRLYFRERLGFNAAPLHVHTAGYFLPFACPFLDIEVLDWMRFVSGQQRLEKRLFAGIVQSKFPDLYGIPRSRFDQTDPDLGQMVRAEETEIREHLTRLTVGVPGVMTPADLQALLTLVLSPKPSTRSAGSLRREAHAAARRVAKVILVSGVLPSWLRIPLRTRTLSNFTWGPDPMTLFQRGLQLAMTFEQLRAGDILKWTGSPLPGGQDRPATRESRLRAAQPVSPRL